MWGIRARAAAGLAAVVLGICSPAVAAPAGPANGADLASALVPEPAEGVMPGGDAAYPRAVVLRHGEDAGAVIATATALPNSSVQRFYRSDDDGSHFEEIATLDLGGNVHGTTLFEVPAAAGTLTAGTLLFSAAVKRGGDYADPGNLPMDLPVFRSDDHGATWQPLSSCFRSDLPAGPRGGLWEPELHVAEDGSLVCVWADETEHATSSQVLAQAVSVDGGQTWGPRQVIVRSPDPRDRPGMATAVALPDGTWRLSYEVCGTKLCAGHLRSGTDGLAWGDPADLGTIPTTAGGTRNFNTPYLSWVPTGDAGVLVYGSWWTLRSATEPGPAGGGLLVSADAGSSWAVVDGPITLDVGARVLIDTYSNYSSPVVPLDDAGTVLHLVRDATTATPVLRFRVARLATPVPAAPTTTTTTTTVAPPPTPAPVAATPTFTG